MQCICGGTLRKQSGKRNDFWGCDQFRAGCRITLPLDEYEMLVDMGIDRLSEKHHTPAQRIWTKPNHRAYLPRQRTNSEASTTLRQKRMSDEQEAAITAALKPGMHRIRINADAGSGKSSLAKQIAVRTRPRPGEAMTGIVLSFNKRPATEMSHDLPPHWVGSTVHSAGNDACAAYYGVNKMRSNKYKTKDMLTAIYGATNNVDRQLLYGVVDELVEMCKALVLTELDTEETIIERAMFYNVSLGEAPQQAAEMARNILKVGSTVQGVRDYGHDFGDMIYLPVRNNLPVATYRYVVVDEAQDSSPARMQLALKMASSSLVIVGDWMQAIYGFTYADTHSMETFGALMGDQREDYPLTINWRCPSIVLDLARILCPTIKARPGAPLGAVHEIDNEDYFQIVQPGDVTLCRVNADLVRAAYQLIKQGIGAVVLGREIGENLKALVKKLGKTKDGYKSTIELISALNTWYDSEGEIIAAKNLRNPDKAYQTLDDTYECILALCGAEITDQRLNGIAIPTVEGVLDKIDQLFGEETDAGFDPKRVVTLSTIHKYKGGQAARIFDLRAAENHPHPMANSQWELDAELCVAHVLVTRCGDGTDSPGQALFFVGGMPAMYRNAGGDQFITQYTGERRC